MRNEILGNFFMQIKLTFIYNSGHSQCIWDQFVIAQEELKITGQFISSDVTYIKDVCLTI